MQVAFEAALQSFVLLKNAAATLPLRRGLTLAVVGPMSVQVDGLRSDYATSPMLVPKKTTGVLDFEYAGNNRCADGTSNCQPSIAQALAWANTGQTIVAPGLYSLLLFFFSTVQLCFKPPFVLRH